MNLLELDNLISSAIDARLAWEGAEEYVSWFQHSDLWRDYFEWTHADQLASTLYAVMKRREQDVDDYAPEYAEALQTLRALDGDS